MYAVLQSSLLYRQSTNLGHHLSRSHSNLLVPNENKKKVYVTDDKSEPLSFEKQRLQNDYKSEVAKFISRSVRLST